MIGVELTFWEPGGPEQVRPLAGTADLSAVADLLLASYTADGDTLPGIELRHGDPADGGQSLSIAVAPFGWALIHTNEDFDQHCTRSDATADGSVDVRWEEPTPIPRTWFIRRAEALAVVDQWVKHGTLSDQIRWSDHCY